MRHRRAIVVALFFAVIILVMPPLFVWTAQAAKAMRSEQSGRFLASKQLYTVWQNREDYLRPRGLIDHPFEYPYLNCDTALPQSMGDLDETLMLTFMGDHEERLRVAYVRLLEKELSIPAATALTACIEATPFSGACAKHVRELTYGQNEKLDMSSEDSKVAGAYCRSVKALIGQARTR